MVLLIGASSLLLAIAALSSTVIALFLTWRIGRKRDIDCALKQTQWVKAIKHKRVPREVREFAMLEVDTSVYLQSVKVFSKKEELYRDYAVSPRRQFKWALLPKPRFRGAPRLSIFTNKEDV